jgi:hypothetical protein
MDEKAKKASEGFCKNGVSVRNRATVCYKKNQGSIGLKPSFILNHSGRAEHEDESGSV